MTIEDLLINKAPTLRDHADAFDVHVYETECVFMRMLWKLAQLKQQRLTASEQQAWDRNAFVDQLIRSYYASVHPPPPDTDTE